VATIIITPLPLGSGYYNITVRGPYKGWKKRGKQLLRGASAQPI